MSTIINSRDDLDNIAGTMEHAAFIEMLRGTLWRLQKDDVAKTWVAVEDDSAIASFGFVRADFPGATPPPLPTYAAPDQESALVAIDAAAGAARARYITVAPGQEATYMLKAEQARAYKAAGYPAASLAAYPMVEAEAHAINGAAPTAAQSQAAADGIIAQADAWIAKAAQIERSRITGKRAVTAAIDVAAVEVARAAAEADLSML